MSEIATIISSVEAPSIDLAKVWRLDTHDAKRHTLFVISPKLKPNCDGMQCIVGTERLDLSAFARNLTSVQLGALLGELLVKTPLPQTSLNIMDTLASILELSDPFIQIVLSQVDGEMWARIAKIRKLKHHRISPSFSIAVYDSLWDVFGVTQNTEKGLDLGLNIRSTALTGLKYLPLGDTRDFRVLKYARQRIRRDDLINYGLYGSMCELESTDITVHPAFVDMEADDIRRFIINGIRIAIQASRHWLVRDIESAARNRRYSVRLLRLANANPAAVKFLFKALDVNYEDGIGMFVPFDKYSTADFDMYVAQALYDQKMDLDTESLKGFSDQLSMVILTEEIGAPIMRQYNLLTLNTSGPNRIYAREYDRSEFITSRFYGFLLLRLFRLFKGGAR